MRAYCNRCGREITHVEEWHLAFMPTNIWQCRSCFFRNVHDVVERVWIDDLAATTTGERSG